MKLVCVTSIINTTSYTATCTTVTQTVSAVGTVLVNNTPAYSQAPKVTVATCNGLSPNNDARIDLIGLENTERADITMGSSYGNGAAYGAASNKAVVNGLVSFTDLPNPTQAQPYTVRLFSNGGICYTDITMMVTPAACECPSPKCVPITISRFR